MTSKCADRVLFGLRQFQSGKLDRQLERIAWKKKTAQALTNLASVNSGAVAAALSPGASVVLIGSSVVAWRYAHSIKRPNTRGVLEVPGRLLPVLFTPSKDTAEDELRLGLEHLGLGFLATDIQAFIVEHSVFRRLFIEHLAPMVLAELEPLRKEAFNGHFSSPESALAILRFSRAAFESRVSQLDEILGRLRQRSNRIRSLAGSNKERIDAAWILIRQSPDARHRWPDAMAEVELELLERNWLTLEFLEYFDAFSQMFSLQTSTLREWYLNHAIAVERDFQAAADENTRLKTEKVRWLMQYWGGRAWSWE